MEKYKIMECLEKLTVSEYRLAIKLLPKMIGRSQNTFWNYVKIKSTDKADIPYTVVVALEKFFGLIPGELINIEISAEHVSELIRRFREQQESGPG